MDPWWLLTTVIDTPGYLHMKQDCILYSPKYPTSMEIKVYIY